jgi:hypothetical protein
MKLEGLDAVHYLNGPHTVRDGALVEFSLRSTDEESVIRLVFKRRDDLGPHI